MRKAMYLEEVLLSWLTTREYSPKAYRQYRLLLHLARKLYPVETHLIMKSICPFCGRSFPKPLLKRHLRMSGSKPCSRLFWLMARDIIEKYDALRAYIRYSRTMRKAVLKNDEILINALNHAQDDEDLLVL